MKIRNKKVNAAIAALEARNPNYSFELRTENTRPDMTSGRYVLYAPVFDGYAGCGPYGTFIEGFRTQKDFIEWAMKQGKE